MFPLRFECRSSPKAEGLAFQVDAILAIVMMFILSTIVYVGGKTFLDNNRTVKARADCAQIGAAISQYKMEIGVLPSGGGEIATSGFANLMRTPQGQYGPWLTRKDRDYLDPWGNSYIYKPDDEYREKRTIFGSNGVHSARESYAESDKASFVVYSMGPDCVDDGSNCRTGISGNDVGFWGK